MKKVILILVALALLAALVGCDMNSLKQSIEKAEDQIENKIDSAVDNAIGKAENQIENAFGQVENYVEGALNSAKSNLLTQEEAEDIAIEHVGLSRSQVQNVRSEYDYENGIQKYEVEFSSEEWEYEFEIHAETGSVISYDKESVWG